MYVQRSTLLHACHVSLVPRVATGFCKEVRILVLKQYINVLANTKERRCISNLSSQRACSQSTQQHKTPSTKSSKALISKAHSPQRLKSQLNSLQCIALLANHQQQKSVQSTQRKPPPSHRAPNNHTQNLRVQIRHAAALVNLPIRVDIVVRERIAPPIDLVLVHESTVPIHRALLIVRVNSGTGLQVSLREKERPPVESGAQARDDGLVDGVVVFGVDGEGAAVAAEDVHGRHVAQVVWAVVAVAG